jgi:hypothetical protein
METSPLKLTTSNSIFQQNTCRYYPYVTSSLKRGWVCLLQLLLVFGSAVIFRSESRGTHAHILLPQIRDGPNSEGQVPLCISPRKKVARLYSQALGSLSVVFYTSQSYGGGIPTHLHAGRLTAAPTCAAYIMARTARKTPFLIVVIQSLRGNILLCQFIVQQRLLYSCISRGRCPITGLHATI